MRLANTRVTASLNFSIEIDVTTQYAHIFVVDEVSLGGAKFADFARLFGSFLHIVVDIET